MIPRRSESTPVTSKEVGNERRGEEHTPMGSGSAYRGKGGGPPPKEVRNLCCGQQLGALGEMQPPGVGDWNYAL